MTLVTNDSPLIIAPGHFRRHNGQPGCIHLWGKHGTTRRAGQQRDGAPAARFTRRLVELIESGYGLSVANEVGDDGSSSEPLPRLAHELAG